MDVLRDFRLKWVNTEYLSHIEFSSLGGLRPPSPILSTRYSSQDWLATVAVHFPLESCPMRIFCHLPEPALSWLYLLSILALSEAPWSQANLGLKCFMEVFLPSQTTSLCPIPPPAALLPSASLVFSSCLLTPLPLPWVLEATFPGLF